MFAMNSHNPKFPVTSHSLHYKKKHHDITKKRSKALQNWGHSPSTEEPNSNREKDLKSSWDMCIISGP